MKKKLIAPKRYNDVNEELLERLRQTLPYLEHPDIQSMNFCIPVRGVAERARSAVERADGFGRPLAEERLTSALVVALHVVDAHLAGNGGQPVNWEGHRADLFSALPPRVQKKFRRVINKS